MSNHHQRPSVDFSLETISPQNNAGKQELPWFCYLCGTTTTENVDLPNMHKKQKVNLSKVSKIKHAETMRKSINEELKFESNISHDNPYRHSLKSQIDVKSTTRTLARTNEPSSSIAPTSQIVNSRLPPSSQILMNSNNHYRPDVRIENRNSFQFVPQNSIVYQGVPRYSIQSVKNVPPNGSQLLRSNTIKFNTDTPQMKKSSTVFFSNPTNNSIIQQNVIKQGQTIKIVPFEQKKQQQKIVLTSCESKQAIQILVTKQNDKFHPSDISTHEQIPPRPQFREVVSIDEPKQLKLHNHKDKSSRSNRVPKFLTNLKRTSSKSEAQKSSSVSDDSSVNYAHFGTKIKIGIRKVQSINSEVDDDEDQYSDVISHGQRSFLMTEIHQVEELSRVSSRSGFKNWEDEEGNPQHTERSH